MGLCKEKKKKEFALLQVEQVALQKKGQALGGGRNFSPAVKGVPYALRLQKMPIYIQRKHVLAIWPPSCLQDIPQSSKGN